MGCFRISAKIEERQRPEYETLTRWYQDAHAAGAHNRNRRKTLP